MDIVQNAVVKALEHYEDLRKPAFLKSWFFRILINECYASMRRKKRGEILYSPEDMEELGRAEEQGMDGVSLYEAVCNLPESMKEVVCLRFYEDMKLDEIAQACDLTLATVKYRLYAALRLLKEEYKEA